MPPPLRPGHLNRVFVAFVLRISNSTSRRHLDSSPSLSSTRRLSERQTEATLQQALAASLDPTFDITADSVRVAIDAVAPSLADVQVPETSAARAETIVAEVSEPDFLTNVAAAAQLPGLVYDVAPYIQVVEMAASPHPPAPAQPDLTLVDDASAALSTGGMPGILGTMPLWMWGAVLGGVVVTLAVGFTLFACCCAKKKKIDGRKLNAASIRHSRRHSNAVYPRERANESCADPDPYCSSRVSKWAPKQPEQRAGGARTRGRTRGLSTDLRGGPRSRKLSSIAVDKGTGVPTLHIDRTESGASTPPAVSPRPQTHVLMGGVELGGEGEMPKQPPPPPPYTLQRCATAGRLKMPDGSFADKKSGATCGSRETTASKLAAWRDRETARGRGRTRGDSCRDGVHIDDEDDERPRRNSALFGRVAVRRQSRARAETPGHVYPSPPLDSYDRASARVLRRQATAGKPIAAPPAKPTLSKAKSSGVRFVDGTAAADPKQGVGALHSMKL